MGSCCTKDPREGHVDCKEARLENQLITERQGKLNSEPDIEESADDLNFKNNALGIKSNKPETNVSSLECDEE